MCLDYIDDAVDKSCGSVCYKVFRKKNESLSGVYYNPSGSTVLQRDYYIENKWYTSVQRITKSLIGQQHQTGFNCFKTYDGAKLYINIYIKPYFCDKRFVVKKIEVKDILHTGYLTGMTLNFVTYNIKCVVVKDMKILSRS